MDNFEQLCSSFKLCIKQIHFFNDFNVSSNLLNTLKDCPKKIDGIFNCSNNNLINLKYSPEIIDGSFFCFKNKLKSPAKFTFNTLKIA